jgi:hypothetical protein
MKLKLWPTVSRPFCLGVGFPSEPITRFFFFSVWQLRISWCWAPSLTRGWVCNLLVQLFLCLTRAMILGSKSLRTHGHILLSHLRLPQSGGQGPRIYILHKQGGPVVHPGTVFPFRRLLLLAGLRWRYSNPPPHGSHRYVASYLAIIVNHSCPSNLCFAEQNNYTGRWLI